VGDVGDRKRRADVVERGAFGNQLAVEVGRRRAEIAVATHVIGPQCVEGDHDEVRGRRLPSRVAGFEDPRHSPHRIPRVCDRGCERQSQSAPSGGDAVRGGRQVPAGVARVGRDEARPGDRSREPPRASQYRGELGDGVRVRLRRIDETIRDLDAGAGREVEGAGLEHLGGVRKRLHAHVVGDLRIRWDPDGELRSRRVPAFPDESPLVGRHHGPRLGGRQLGCQ
jgi:hypothetical protein